MWGGGISKNALIFFWGGGGYTKSDQVNVCVCVVHRLLYFVFDPKTKNKARGMIGGGDGGGGGGGVGRNFG